MDKIKRQAGVWETIENYMNKNQQWQCVKTVAVVSGLCGCGKTALLLDYFKDKKHFYFSFAGLAESVAERLFTQKVAAVTEKQLTNCIDAVVALTTAYRHIIF